MSKPGRSPLVSVRLELELTNGNDGRGDKWFSSSKVRKQFEAYLRASGLDRTEAFGFPVQLELTRILKPRQSFWDSDSKLRGNAKELIDALVVCGWFVDDGPKWITETLCHQDASQRQSGPAILVEVFAADVPANG